MHLRGLVLLLVLLPGGARQSHRVNDAQRDAQQQINTLANGLQVSSEAREALVPGRLRARTLRRAGPQADVSEPNRAAPIKMVGQLDPPKPYNLDDGGSALAQPSAQLKYEDILSISRRKLVAAGTAGLSAEAAWRQAVLAATDAIDEVQAVAAATDAIEAVPALSILPPRTAEQIQAGRAVVIRDWLPPDEVAALRNDQIACLEGWEQTKNFKLFQSNIHTGTILSMPSFFVKGKEGPFVDPSVGDISVRQNLMARMAVVKAALADQAKDRPTLANDIPQTHEIQYLHYYPGGQVFRHVDDRHVELKRPNGSRLPKRPDATRRSITWLVYLNEDWDSRTDGGQLRTHERAQPSAAHVGAAGPDLQVGWLRATGTVGEEPVFLDPFREGPTDDRVCMLYTCDANGNKRDLSREPFPSEVLRKTGGDWVASLMVDDPADVKRFHLVDAPRTVIEGKILSRVLSQDPKGVDGGERVRDIDPQAGTLVLFDSVSVPHEVLATTRKRYGLQGWFHEKLYY